MNRNTNCVTGETAGTDKGGVGLVTGSGSARARGAAPASAIRCRGLGLPGGSQTREEGITVGDRTVNQWKGEKSRRRGDSDECFSIGTVIRRIGLQNPVHLTVTGIGVFGGGSINPVHHQGLEDLSFVSRTSVVHAVFINSSDGIRGPSG